MESVSIFPGLRDHRGVHCKLTLPVPELQNTEITFRKYKNINKAEFQSDIIQAFTLLDTDQDLDYLVGEYNSILKSTLDKHAPMITKRNISRSENP